MQKNKNVDPSVTFSQEELEEQLEKDLMGKLKEGIFSPEDPEKERDYTYRKKVIFKGKMAPPGFIYVVMDLSVGKSKYQAVRMMNGKVAKISMEALLYDMREQIREKYEV